MLFIKWHQRYFDRRIQTLEEKLFRHQSAAILCLPLQERLHSRNFRGLWSGTGKSVFFFLSLFLSFVLSISLFYLFFFLSCFLSRFYLSFFLSSLPSLFLLFIFTCFYCFLFAVIFLSDKDISKYLFLPYTDNITILTCNFRLCHPSYPDALAIALQPMESVFGNLHRLGHLRQRLLQPWQPLRRRRLSQF